MSTEGKKKDPLAGFVCEFEVIVCTKCNREEAYEPYKNQKEFELIKFKSLCCQAECKIEHILHHPCIDDCKHEAKHGQWQRSEKCRK